MKRSTLLIFQIVFITFLLLLMSVSSAAAEEGDTPQIALSVYQASPGATIEVTGGRFEPDIQVTLILFQNEMQIQLGTILCDDHGEFTSPLLLPTELQAGEYEFRAVDEKNRTAVTPLVIVANGSGGEDTLQRQDEDGLLAPMPTYAPGFSSTSLPQAASPVDSGPISQSSSTGVSWALIVAAIAGSLILIRFRRRLR